MWTLAKPLFFAFLLFSALLFFVRSAWRLYRLVRLGRSEGRFENIPRRVGWFLWYVFGQRRVVRQGPGVVHFLIFWGFWILLIGDVEFLIKGVYPSFSLSILGPVPHGAFQSAQEVAAIVSFVAAIVAMVWRLAVPRRFYDRVSPEALAFVLFICGLAACVGGANACEVNLGTQAASAWRPLTNSFAASLGSLPDRTVAALHESFSWTLAAILLTFFYVFPWPFHLHIVGAMANIFFRSTGPVNTLPVVDFESESGLGAAKANDFTWKGLLDCYACNECGRCQANCPAYITAKPLSPKKIVLDVKASLFEEGDALLRGKPAGDPPLVGGKGVQEDELWSCTTCGACMEQCPVFIEHVPKIVEMRRALVMAESRFPSELNAFFRNLETNGNPWPIPASQRAKWADGLNVPLIEQNLDVEYLFWVGCAGSFNERAQKASAAMVRLMRSAGVSFAILGTQERCTGDAARRLGHEYLFQQLAQQNIETLNRYGVKRIVTCCPHCFSTLKNDYAQFGGHYEVIHHSQLIAGLLNEGRLRLDRKPWRVVFHDPCWLGRMNLEYAAPRAVIQAAGQRVEMHRSRDRSLCCGAGGGRMWMEEKLGTRINHERVGEAAAASADLLCVACPFCNTMLSDAVQDLGLEARLPVMDIAEIAMESLS